jgi:hypothetical protein
MRGTTELRRHGGNFMAEPTIAQRSPFRLDVTQGKSYWWCACGRSQRNPLQAAMTLAGLYQQRID